MHCLSIESVAARTQNFTEMMICWIQLKLNGCCGFFSEFLNKRKFSCMFCKIDNQCTRERESEKE